MSWTLEYLPEAEKDLINVKNSYVIFRITMILKSVFQILLLYSI